MCENTNYHTVNGLDGFGMVLIFAIAFLFDKLCDLMFYYKDFSDRKKCRGIFSIAIHILLSGIYVVDQTATLPKLLHAEPVIEKSDKIKSLELVIFNFLVSSL